MAGLLALGGSYKYSWLYLYEPGNQRIITTGWRLQATTFYLIFTIYVLALVSLQFLQFRLLLLTHTN